jgi:hypothetical protein
MKCIKMTVGGEIKRVENEVAFQYVAAGEAMFVPRAMWKKVRPALVAESDKVVAARVAKKAKKTKAKDTAELTAGINRLAVE